MKAAYKNIAILICYSLIHFIPLHGQCVNGDSLLNKISFLRDSSGLSATEQIKTLSSYESGMVACTDNHDSVYVTLLQRMGKLFYALANYSKAIKYYRGSIDLMNRNATKPSVNLKDMIPAYYWLSACYDSLHLVTEKMNALDSCASNAIKLKSIDIYCLWALYTRAEHSFNIGDYHRCMNYASLCESLATEVALKGSKENVSVGTQYSLSSLLWQINVLMILKKYDDAEKLLEIKAVEFRKKGLQHNLGVIYGSLAEVLELKGNFEKVLFYHDKAFAIESRWGEPINCKAMLNSLGYEVWFKHYKNTDKALEYYRRALNYKVPEDEFKVWNSLESLSILNRIGNVYVLKGRYDDAFRYLQLAFDQIQPGFNETELLESSLDEFVKQRKMGYIATLITDKAIAFHQRYNAIGRLDDIKEAVRIYKIADQFLEKIKTEQSDVRSKLFWRSDRRRLYELAIEACHSYGNTVDAFYFFERSRAVLLFDELRELHLMNNEEVIRQAQLKRNLAQLEGELSHEDKASNRSRKLQEDVLIYQQELDQLNKKINSRNPLFYQNLSGIDEISLSEAQHKLLKGNDKLVEFFDGDSAVYTMIISATQVFLEKINKDSFDRAVTTFVSYISSNNLLNKNFKEFLSVSHRLYELVFQKHNMAPGKIIVSPDGQYFPAEALATDKSVPPVYLVQNHPISYTHSARLLMVDFTTKASSGMKNFLGIAPVNFLAQFKMPSLIGSDVSLQALRSNFRNTNCLTFSMASKINFLQEYPAYKVIQLYTHATDNENVGEPEIYFADSILHLSELMSGRKPFAKLIVLSACETGTGEWNRGEGVFSFNRGFAALGIPSSVANLWSVDDVSTYRLTELFYKYLARGLPVDISLQKAKLEFIKDSSEERSLPYYWAATILAGKTDAIEFKKPFPRKSLAFLFALAGGLLFFGYILWTRRKKIPSVLE